MGFLNVVSAEQEAQPIQSIADGFVKFLDNNTGDTQDYRTDHFVQNSEYVVANNRHYNYNSLMMGWPNENAPTEATVMAILGFLHLYIASDYKNKDYLARAEKYWDAYVKTFFGGVPIPDTPTYWPDNWVANGKEPKLACYPIDWSIPYSSGFLDVELDYTNGQAQVPYGAPYFGEYLTYAYQAYRGELGYRCVKAFVQKYNDDGSVNWEVDGNGESHLVDWIVNEDGKKIKFNGNWGGVSADIIEDHAKEPKGTIQLVDTNVNGTYKTTFACKLPVALGGYEIQRNEPYICWPIQVPVAVANLQPASDATEWFLDATRILFTITKKEKYKKAFRSEDYTLYKMANFSEGLKYLRICHGNYGFKTDGLAISYSWSPNAKILPTYTRSKNGYLVTTCHEEGKVWLDNKGTWVSFAENGGGAIHIEIGGTNPDNMNYKVEIRTEEQATTKYAYTFKGTEAGQFSYTKRDNVDKQNIVALDIPVSDFSFKTLSGSPISGIPEVVYDTAVNDEAPKGAYTNYTCYYPEPTENQSVWGNAEASYREEVIDYGDYTAKGGVTRYTMHSTQAEAGATLGFWHTYDNVNHSGVVALKVIPATIRYRSNCPIGLKFVDANGYEFRLKSNLPNTNGRWSTWHFPVERSNWKSDYAGSIVFPEGFDQISLDIPDDTPIPSEGGYFEWARVNTPSQSGTFTSGNIRYISIMAENEKDTTWAIATGDCYPVNYESNLKYCPGTMPYGNNSTTEAPEVEAWRGYPYTGYQYPMIYIWSEFSSFDYMKNMCKFLYDAQQEYNNRFGVLGPVMQSYYWERWDSVERGTADTFTNETFDNSWSGYEPRAFFGSARAYYLLTLSKKTIPSTMKPYLENWVNFLISFYKNHDYLPDYFPEAGGPSKQPTYDDFPIICLYCASLCELRMAGMNIKGMDTLIDWCIQYIRNMYIVVVGKPEHVFNGGISQKPALDDEHTDHQQSGEFYGYQAGEILRTLGLYMQYKRGIKEDVWFDINYVEPDPTPDPEPTEPDPVEPDPEPEEPEPEEPIDTPDEPEEPTPTEPDTPIEETPTEITSIDVLKTKLKVNSVDVSSMWDSYKTYFNTDKGYIRDESQNAAHSESTGYGMLFEVASGDKESFDKTLAWADANLLNTASGLYSWRYLISGTNHVPDKNNATDGDILAAWALLKAAVIWEDISYLNRAKRILTAIKEKCVKVWEGYTLLLPGWNGFDHSTDASYQYVVVNPCYYIFAALKDFYTVTADEVWKTLITDGERLTADFITKLAPAEKILPDWFTIEKGGTFNFDKDHTRQSGWDAIRCPLYSYWYDRDHAWVKLWKNWYATKEGIDKIPAKIDIVSSGVADSMYSEYTGFKAVYNLVNSNTPATQLSKSSYYLDSLEFLSYLAYHKF